MLERIRAGEFSHLLVWKLDRISRNLLDFAAMYDELKRLGVIFVSKNEQFDTGSAMGEAMLKIILVFAELERKVTSERVTSVMYSRAASGSWNGGKIPYGYDYDKATKTFRINSLEAVIVKMMYDLYEEKHSLLAVAKTLNDRGISSRSGKPWNPTTVSIILKNPFYTGAYRYNYREEGVRQRVKDESDWIIVENHHPAIIETERWQNICEVLSSQNRTFLPVCWNAAAVAVLCRPRLTGNAPTAGDHLFTPAPENVALTTAQTNIYPMQRLALLCLITFLIFLERSAASANPHRCPRLRKNCCAAPCSKILNTSRD